MADVQDRIADLPPDKLALLGKRLADMAAARGAVRDDRIKARDRAKPTPLAFQQEREWAIGQFRGANNIPGAFHVEGALDLELFSRVLTEVVARHEVLRSTVEMQADGSLHQVVHPVAPVPVPLVDLSGLPPGEQHTQVLRRWQADALAPFDPARHQRIRACAIRLGEGVHIVLITTDHAAADLVSVSLLMQELAALYVMRQDAGEALRPPEMPPLEIQYGDFAAWQRDPGQQRHATELDHWRRTLEGIPGQLVLPSDRPYPAQPTFAGDIHAADLPPDLAVGVQRLTDGERIPLSAVLLAACSVLAYRYLGQDDLVIGELVSGRSRVETERLIGSFAAALPLRMRISEEQTLDRVLEHARQVVLTAYDHQDLPVDRLIEQLGLGLEASRTSMSHLWIDVRTPAPTIEVPGLRITAEPVGANVTDAPVTLHASRDAGLLQLHWAYMTEMFDAGTAALLADQFTMVLGQIVGSPHLTVAQVELAMTGDAAFRPTSRAAADDEPTFVESFQRLVTRAPHAPAVACGPLTYSYAELNQAANRLARQLRSLGVGPETPVGILLDRSVALPTAILAVLKAGGAFVPLDPAYPPERTGFVLADAGATVLISQRNQAATLASAGVAVPAQVVLLDDPDLPRYSPDGDPDLPGLPTGSQAAYVIYTSGSTGQPKGTVIEHRSLTVFARDVAERLGLGTEDQFLQFASPGFDVIIEELFPTWLAGGTVVLPDSHIISGGVDLAELAAASRITVMELPTAFWHEWTRQVERAGRPLPDCLRLVIIGGERVLPERVASWRSLGVDLAHVYGLTETTCSSTFHVLDRSAPEQAWMVANLPIGSPLPSADLRVLDARLRPVPMGAIGELYIGGVSLARGYLNRPGLTAQRFIADPAGSGQRLYRTGDLVRQRSDDTYEFLSRSDTQIKIRGFRVEPAEVESALARHPSIAEAVAGLWEPTPGDRRLAAWLVPAPGVDVPASELRGFLERELPAHMIPAAFVMLDELPLNASGKIDRSRLPAPEGSRPGPVQDYAAPENPMQQQLASIVAAAVGIDRIGIHDNFFEAGGDSILAIQVAARAQDAGLRLSPYDIFVNPTVAALAEIAGSGPAIDAEQGDISGPVPVAPTQRLFTRTPPPDPADVSHTVVLALAAPVNPDILRQAIEHLLVHHDALRQRILLAGQRTRIRIAPRGDATPFQAHDLTGLSEADQDHRLAELTGTLRASLNLAVGPLLRAAHVRLGGPRPDRLVLVVHQMAADIASLQILLDDIETMTVQLTAGEQVTLPPKTTSWQSWTRKLTSHAGDPAIQDQRGYWTEVASEAPAPARIADYGDTPADAAGTTATITVTVGAARAADLLGSAPDALSCRTEELLLAALSRSLTTRTGAARHLIDYQRRDRVQVFAEADLSRTVGPFTRIHPLALTCPPPSDPATTLRTVKDAVRAVPDGGIAWQLLFQDDPALRAPIDVAFDFRPAFTQPATGMFTVTAQPSGPGEAGTLRLRRPLEIEASVVDGELTVCWHHDRARCDAATVEGLAATFLTELAALLDLSRIAPGSPASPSDFPLARVDQDQLDSLMRRL
jgi:amino acid adenylation domain-containing protein/non-ribosomal peptide synthase protein (TIGR01720 family)